MEIKQHTSKKSMGQIGSLRGLTKVHRMKIKMYNNKACGMQPKAVMRNL